jgi:hypothetical protein
VKSSGTPAKDSTYPTGQSLAGSITTPYPSRCTRTVSVSNRNSLGNRTAWLLPVQNTLALLAFNGALLVYIDDIYHCALTSSQFDVARRGDGNRTKNSVKIVATLLHRRTGTMAITKLSSRDFFSRGETAVSTHHRTSPLPSL